MKALARFRVVGLIAALAVWPAAAHGQDHQGHGGHQQAPAAPPAEPAPDPHAGHEMAAPEQATPYPGLPPITDADRAAAFPDVRGHAVHDRAVNTFVLFDQLEWEPGGDNNGNWDAEGWIGRDVDRFWFRTEGQTEDGRVGDAEFHAMYGRAFARWWDVVAGVRQDIRPDPQRTWAAIGVQGLAPYLFDIEATAYVGESGRTAARFQLEYELLLTNRLILQPLFETELYGKADPERGIGAGLSTMEVGLRMRYEFRRELAPYVGIVWNRKFGGTADFAKAAGEDVSRARVAVGLRVWF